MAPLRRAARLGLAVVTLASGLLLIQPSPTAQANTPCDIATGPAGVITGAVGAGNPVGDACNTVTDPALDAAGLALDPLRSAAGAIGGGVFGQITDWVGDGAIWLLGEVAKAVDETTSPDLTSKGFLSQYRQMAMIAIPLAALMLLLAIVEGVGRGDLSMLWRVFFISAPLAAVATSAAYVVVQLLLVVTDGLCQTVAASAEDNTERFFKGAVQALSTTGAETGGAVGKNVGEAAGAVEVPLFVGFIAAILTAFAALLLWLELLMRDAAVYATSLFLPLAIAASIWPRWTGALRRTAEIVLVTVFSKFAIASILALSASLLAHNDGDIEHVLAASTLLLLACCSPLVLMRLVPFAEGALGAAHTRQSAAGGIVHGMQVVSSAAIMQRSLSGGEDGLGRLLSGGRSGGGAGNGPGGSRPAPGGGGKGPPDSDPPKPSGAAGLNAREATTATDAASAPAPPAGGVAVPTTGGERSAETQARGAEGSSDSEGTHPIADRWAPRQTAGEAPSRPRSDKSEATSGLESMREAEPTEAAGGSAPVSDPRPARPKVDPPGPHSSERGL